MRILLPVDGSDYTQRMLDYVAAHDDLFPASAEHLVLTVVPPLPPQVSHFIAAEAIEGYQREQAEAVLGPVRAFGQRHGWTMRAWHVVGHPAESIAAAATAQQVDLVVMGSHGHGALGNVILGSVANGVLGRCKTPVLLVR